MTKAATSQAMTGEDYRPRGTERMGSKYWCVKSDLSNDGEIFLHAEDIEITTNGTLIVRGTKVVNLVIAAGHWTAVFAASVLDGSAVAVDHWDGEVQR